MIRVSISYACADGSEAAALVEKQLESSGFQVWRDVRSLDAFNDFSVEIERAIIAADVVVVILTPSIRGLDAVVRPYQRLEDTDPMRRQIESYLAVRRRLGLS